VLDSLGKALHQPGVCRSARSGAHRAIRVDAAYGDLAPRQIPEADDCRRCPTVGERQRTLRNTSSGRASGRSWGTAREPRQIGRGGSGTRLSNLSSEGSVQWRGFEEQLLDIAPAPVLPRLEGLDYLVVCGVEMLRRVFVGGVVTATNVTTVEAQTQVHPPAASAEALLATFGRSRLDVANLVEMCARHLVCL